MDNTSFKGPILTNADGFRDWKEAFENFIRSKDWKLWKSITQGPRKFTKQLDDAGKTLVPKTEEELTDAEYELADVDYKALSNLKMALSTEISQGFRSYTTAKELWTALLEVYEGNTDMQESRRDFLRTNFNMFNHIHGESLEAQLNRFTKLHSEMISAGISLDKSEVNKKLLNSLPQAWDHEIALLKRTLPLKTTTLADLIGYIKSYEMDTKQRKMNHISTFSNAPSTAFSALPNQPNVQPYYQNSSYNPVSQVP